MRYDIAFFLCCCRSFLSSSGRDDSESFYDLLGVSPDAAPDELKRAYKRQSLLMHPDKLAQRGLAVTERDRDRFTRMRHAFEVLSDPRRRETYDAIGERGMRWVEEPLSVDPQELAHNFATSSLLDRSKIFAIFMGVYAAVFALPVLVCLMADGTMGDGATWTAVLVPLWLWDAFVLFYHSRVILMGPIRRPDHVPEEEWVDPLPMSRRVAAMVRFVLLVAFQVLLALRLDGHLAHLPWTAVFAPLYLWDAMALRRKIALASLVVVTHDELELAIGKRLGECTPAERESASRRYVVVPPPGSGSSARDAADRLIGEARTDVVRILARATFSVLLAMNLDAGGDGWSWWLVFLPVFGASAVVAGCALRNLARAQSEAAGRDPAAFGGPPPDTGSGDGLGTPSPSSSSPYAKMGEEKKGEDVPPPSSLPPLTDEEREELRARVAQSAYRAAGACLSQCFVVVMACVLIGKIDGAGYSLLVVISPFLAAGGIVLCCLACTIFCISEVDENAGMAEFDTAVGRAAAAGYDPPTASSQRRGDPTGAAAAPVGVGGASATAGASTTGTTTSSSCGTSKKPPPSSRWDPEMGEIWQNATPADEEEEEEEEEEGGMYGGGCDVKRLEETAEQSTHVPDSECRRIEENHSVSSSQCDLD